MEHSKLYSIAFVKCYLKIKLPDMDHEQHLAKRSAFEILICSIYFGIIKSHNIIRKSIEHNKTRRPRNDP